MIFAGQVKEITEAYLRSTSLRSYPKTLDALLSHPELPEWYRRVAEELTRQQALSIAQDLSFNPVYEIMSWASEYVRTALGQGDAKLKPDSYSARVIQPTAIQEFGAGDQPT